MQPLLPPGGDVMALYTDVERPAPPDRPWVLANMVGGLDGSAAIGGRVGELSSGADRELFRLVRSLPDVLLVGAGTVRAEKYRPLPIPLAVVTRSLELDWSSSTFAGASVRPIVITCGDADPERRRAAEVVADVIVAGDASVDLAAALQALRDRGAMLVVTEGGPALLGELIAVDLVDELCLTVTPLVGGDPLPIVRNPPGAALRRFRLAHVVEGDGDLFLRYLRGELA